MMNVDPPSSNTQPSESMMASLLYKLLRVLSNRPTLFFIDDMQWADPQSLALLTLLVKGADGLQDLGNVRINSTGSEDLRIMFVGSYRDNEISSGHPLVGTLQRFQSDKSLSLTEISLGRLSLDTLNLMLSETLCVPKRRTRELSDLVIQKTDGQPLHVVEFIRTLATDRLLTYSFERGWEWDADSISTCSMSSFDLYSVAEGEEGEDEEEEDRMNQVHRKRRSAGD